MKKLLCAICLLVCFVAVSHAQSFEPPLVTALRLLLNLSTGATSNSARCAPGRVYRIHGQSYRCIDPNGGPKTSAAVPAWRDDPYDERNRIQPVTAKPEIACRSFTASGTVAGVWTDGASGQMLAFTLKRKRLGTVKMFVPPNKVLPAVHKGEQVQAGGKICGTEWTVTRVKRF